MTDRRLNEVLQAVPFAGLLLILPFPGTVAMRLLMLTAAFLVAVFAWQRFKTPAIPCRLALLLWAGVAVVSLAYAADPAYSLTEVKNEIGYAMMAFLAFFSFTRDPARLKVIVTAAIAGAMILSTWVLIVFMQVGYWDEGRGHGGVGAFASLAVAVMPMLGLALALFVERWQRVLIVVAVIVLAFAVFHSHQRILWVALGVQGAIGLLLLRSAGVVRIRPIALLALLLAGVLATGALILSTHEKRVLAGDKMESSIERDYRIAHWGRVMARVAEHPLSGAGFGREGMKRAYPDLVPGKPPQSMLWHPHNVFLTYGIGMGFPGIAALVFLFASLGWTLWRRGGNGKLQAATSAAGIVLLAGVVTRNFTNDFFMRDGALMFWALTGALLGFLSRSHNAAERN